MKLHATPLSHFSRKVRILLDLYRVPYEFVDVGNVAEGSSERFAGNPLCRVPVLVDGAETVFDSDAIAEYIVRKHDPADRYRVRASGLNELNLRTVLNGVMSEEVTVIIAGRRGVPTRQYPFFEDSLDTIKAGLAWLETRSASFSAANPGYLEFHLICVVEHLAYYELVPLAYPALNAVVQQVSADPIIQGTSPSVLKPRKTS